MNIGHLCISLDFELMWGMIDQPNAQTYKESNINQVPEVITKLLKTFSNHDVHATFASVGFISYNNPKELLKELPSFLPQYNNHSLNPYSNDFIKNIPEKEYPLFFGPRLIDSIKSTPGMEVGTHTFSHYYCWEEGQTVEQFEEDIKKAKERGIKDGVEIKSIIFPRNNVSKEYTDICKKHGITAYRGNPSKFFDNKNGRIAVLCQKISRLLDNYINISGSNSYSIDKVKENGMYNVKASRFLRPYSNTLKILEPLRLKRIKSEMTKAAKRGEIYHLWWHPHNFGANMEQNFTFLNQILEHYDFLKEKYGMKSLNMGEIAEFVSSSKL